jgi:enamine deaminase RidA (YjgF/YER057c/UK114 family)
MDLIPGGFEAEANLSLRHVERILEAHGIGLERIVQVRKRSIIESP